MISVSCFAQSESLTLFVLKEMSSRFSCLNSHSLWYHRLLCLDLECPLQSHEGLVPSLQSYWEVVETL
jgi:hypothetical protein